jgi:hypothetical protein
MMTPTSRDRYELVALLDGEPVPVADAIRSVWIGERKPDEYSVDLAAFIPQQIRFLRAKDIEDSNPQSRNVSDKRVNMAEK